MERNDLPHVMGEPPGLLAAGSYAILPRITEQVLYDPPA